MADVEVSQHGFSRIRALPEERLTHVNNWLGRGGEVMALTRVIQQEWKIWTDVAERTLFQQLNRYKRWLLTQQDIDLPSLRTQDGAIVVKAARKRNIDVMERMNMLVAVQEQRLQTFLNQEAKLGMPIAGVDKTIEQTKELLKDIQKLRFDLGMDQYCGLQPANPMLRGASKTVTQNPDGSTSTTTQLFEAVAMADQILGRAAIPSNLTVLGRDENGPGA